jgi:hypothetical protein
VLGGHECVCACVRACVMGGLERSWGEGSGSSAGSPAPALVSGSLLPGLAAAALKLRLPGLPAPCPSSRLAVCLSCPHLKHPPKRLGEETRRRDSEKRLGEETRRRDSEAPRGSRPPARREPAEPPALASPIRCARGGRGRGRGRGTLWWYWVLRLAANIIYIYIDYFRGIYSIHNTFAVTFWWYWVLRFAVCSSNSSLPGSPPAAGSSSSDTCGDTRGETHTATHTHGPRPTSSPFWMSSSFLLLAAASVSRRCSVSSNLKPFPPNPDPLFLSFSPAFRFARSSCSARRQTRYQHKVSRTRYHRHKP